MMSFEYLQPISDAIHSEIIESQDLNLGKKILMHTKHDFPDLNQVKIALVGVLDNRGDKNFEFQPNLETFRSEFYKLYPGNWDFLIADLGDLKAGNTQLDTYHALSAMVTDLAKRKILTIVIGGSQDLTYSVFRAYDALEQMVNLTTIDAKFDIGKMEDAHNNDSYISKIIANPPYILHNFSNLGYQTFYNSQEELDLIDKMHFEAYRIGELFNDFSIAEPVLRDSDIVSLDFKAIKSSATGNFACFQPNGFDGVSICKLARYAGISDRVGVFGIFNLHNLISENILLSQIIWYFIEGYHFRFNEYPFESKTNYTKYYVVVGELELKFYKSNKSNRWWMEVPSSIRSDNNFKNSPLLACSEDDYLRACDQEIPERWWKSVKKQII